MESRVRQLIFSELKDNVKTRGLRGAVREDSFLLLAPHEYSDRERTAILRKADWAWVHLTSAGYDFVRSDSWPRDTLLTRTWRGYAAPITEYVVHAVLTAEWGHLPPWSTPDSRPTSGGETAPAPSNEDSEEYPFGIWGKRIGVAGWGEIGERVGNVFAAMGASVVALSAGEKPISRDGIIHTTDKMDLLDVDHLVIALPSNPATRGTFSSAWLRSAKLGMHIVNVARPDIIDQHELVSLCRAGALSATLDTSSPEPLALGDPVRSLSSIRISPHVAWRSRSSNYAFVADFVEIWRSLAAGDPVPGRVLLTSAARASAQF